MTSDNENARGSAMEGNGFYNQNSAMQAAGIGLLLPFWKMACRTARIDNGPLVIVDYGSSEGRNSMAPMRIAIEELRMRVPGVPIEVIHTDLPSNDFSSLFRELVGATSYMAGMSGIFSAAIGRTYFHQLLPAEQVHLGWNSWTMQWLSESSGDAPDHVVAGLSTDESVSSAVRTQKAADWERFLEARSSEMRSGARLLTAFTGRTTEETGWEWLGGQLWAAVLDVGQAGSLSDEETRRITIPIGLRTREEIAAPFVPSGRFAELELEQLAILKVPDPIWNEFQRTGDRQQFARSHSHATRAWSGPTITGLIDPTRDRASLVEDIFARLAARITETPRKHEPHMAVALLAKR